MILISSLVPTITSKADGNLDEIYGAYIEEASEKYGVSYELIEAMIIVESSGNPEAINGSCYGLMQINGDVWGYEYTSPRDNILKGTEILMDYAEESYMEVSYALDKYNGLSVADENYENGVISGYAQKVFDISYELEEEHGKHNY